LSLPIRRGRDGVAETIWLNRRQVSGLSGSPAWTAKLLDPINGDPIFNQGFWNANTSWDYRQGVSDAAWPNSLQFRSKPFETLRLRL